MRFLIKLLLWCLAVVALIGLAIILLLAWSSGRTKTAHADCEMRMIEHRISLNTANEYRRQCMRAQGYGMMPNCYIEGYTTASCFIPRWVFWVRLVDL